MNQEWDSKTYTTDFSYVHQYGGDVMNLIDFAKARSVLDLGCGNGALTAKFAEKGLQVTGMDASETMLAVARQAYPEIHFVQGDATDFSLPEPVDVIFSNAVFHWIDKTKQPAMMKCVYRALNPGGQLVLEMGGCGDNQSIHGALRDAFAKRGYTYIRPQYFPTVGEYAPMLEQAGFKVVYAVLFDRPTELKGENGLENWIRMFVLSAFDVMSESERDAIIDEVVASLREKLYRDGKWMADYVRLRMKAVKA